MQMCIYTEHLIQSTKVDFDIITISKSRMIKYELPTNDASLPNYSYEFCAVEANAGNTLIHVSNHLSYKSRNDLIICKPSELESTFLEMCHPKKSLMLLLDASTNIQIWTLMNSAMIIEMRFLINYLKKKMFLLADIHPATNEFLDSFISLLSSPYFTTV